jgi:hypothetical protein
MMPNWTSDIEVFSSGCIFLICNWMFLFDVRLFNPFAASNRNQAANTPKSIYQKHKQEKRRVYNQYACPGSIEHASFVLLVFSATGGMGPSTSVAY